MTAGFRVGEVVFTVSRKPGLEEEEAGSPADETQQKVREGQTLIIKNVMVPVVKS